MQNADSLYGIATRFGTTWQHIMKTNPLTILDERSLYEGQLLCVAPVSSPTDNCTSQPAQLLSQCDDF